MPPVHRRGGPRCTHHRESATRRPLPLEEAEAYQQMFAADAGAENRPLSPADLASKLGKKESYVRLRLRLLSADAAVQDALRKEQITEGHALEMARLDKLPKKSF